MEIDMFKIMFLSSVIPSKLIFKSSSLKKSILRYVTVVANKLEELAIPADNSVVEIFVIATVLKILTFTLTTLAVVILALHGDFLLFLNDAKLLSH